MKPGQQALAMLQVAADYRAAHCRSLLDKASARSGSVLRRAQLAARRELRATLAPELDRLAAEAAADQAKLLTLRRMREQRLLSNILEQAWPRLAQALRERWETPSGRACWVTHHLSIAVLALPAPGWLIQHPQNWSAVEIELTEQWLQTHGIAGARFEVDSDLPAGIRVVCGLNILDASLQGLLTDRTQIEGRLLHYLAQAT